MRSRSRMEHGPQGVVVNLLESLKGLHRAVRQFVECCLILAQQDLRLVEDTLAEIKRELLEDLNVQLELSQILQTLGGRPLASLGLEHQADVYIRPRSDLTTARAPKEEHRQHVGILTGMDGQSLQLFRTWQHLCPLPLASFYAPRAAAGHAAE